VGIGVDFVEEEKHVLGRISLSIDWRFLNKGQYVFLCDTFM
jgi:hypothetical protein